MKSAAAASVLPVLARMPAAAAATPNKRDVPSSGEQIPVMGMGSSRTFSSDPGNDERGRLKDVLQVFFDNGGAVVDTSPMYGEAERLLGELIQGVRGHEALFAATKVWTYGRESGIEQMQQSMELMNVDRFDLIQIHNLRDWRVHVETLKQWKAEGKVRYFGITTSHGRSHGDLLAALNSEAFDFVQFTYSIASREAEERLLPLARDRGIATLINRPFERGELFSKVKGKPLPDWADEIDCASWGQYFLKFCLGHDAVTCLIPATSKPHHMADNMAAGFGRLPEPDMQRRMLRHFESL